MLCSFESNVSHTKVVPRIITLPHPNQTPLRMEMRRTTQLCISTLLHFIPRSGRADFPFLE